MTGLHFCCHYFFLLALGWNPPSGPLPPRQNPPHHDIRAVAHWFDPVFFQWNLVMASLVVLVAPSLALSYIQNMANQKERRLYRDVPLERQSEVRRRMKRRASFSAYRGSVWLTMTVVLLGIGGVLFLKPELAADNPGLNTVLSTNGLLIGPFFEVFEKNHASVLFPTLPQRDRFPIWIPGRLYLFHRHACAGVLHAGF